MPHKQMSAPTPTLIFSGPVGAGKSAVALAAHEILRANEIPNAYFDLDSFTCAWPQTDRFNQQLVFDGLEALWPVCRRSGVERLALVRVVETAGTLRKYTEILGGAHVKFVRVTASERHRKNRLMAREQGASLELHLQRTMELEAILEAAAIEHYLVRNEDRAVEDVAEEALKLCGW